MGKARVKFPGNVFMQFFVKLFSAYAVSSQRKPNFSTTITLLNTKSFLTRVYESTREPNCSGIRASETLRHLRTRVVARVAAQR